MSRSKKSKTHSKKPIRKDMIGNLFEFVPLPLHYDYKRGKVGKKLLETIFRVGAGVFDGYVLNWIGAGLFAATLKAVFESEEPEFVEARQYMKDAGITKRPKQIHFDTLTVLESHFPALVHCDELRDELGIDDEELDDVLRYLRGFVLVMCGICVLRDGQRHVGIADVGLWVNWQNRMSKMDSGVSKSRKAHGLNKRNLKRHSLKVQEELPQTRPALLVPDQLLEA